MAVIRRNILTNPEVRDAYVRGVLLLKQQETSFLTSAYNIPGTAVPVRTYDLFVIWHHKTMRTPVPPDGDSGTRTLPTVARSSYRGIGSCSGSWS
jgi:tyrosinase